MREETNGRKKKDNWNKLSASVKVSSQLKGSTKQSRSDSYQDSGLTEEDGVDINPLKSSDGDLNRSLREETNG
eukprot:scaffold120016_cov74-Cyclotella_meneghiniana.AAC.1